MPPERMTPLRRSRGKTSSGERCFQLPNFWRHSIPSSWERSARKSWLDTTRSPIIPQKEHQSKLGVTPTKTAWRNSVWEGQSANAALSQSEHSGASGAHQER
jgi:hypothetical protein